MVVGQEPRPAADRVALTLLLLRRERRRALPAPRGQVRRPAAGAAHARHHRGGGRPRRLDGHPRQRRDPGRRAGARHRGGPVRPAGPGHDLDGCFVYRTIEDLEAIRDGGHREGRRGHRRRPARFRGQRPGVAGPGDPCRGDGAAAAGPASTRPAAAPSCGTSGARRRGAPRRRHAAVVDADGHVAGPELADARSTPRSSCSPRASGPATSSPGPAGCPSPSAAACARRRAVPHRGPARVRDRRVRRPGRADVRPGRPRLLDGRGRGGHPARRRGVVHRRGHVHQASLLGVDVASFGDALATRPAR